MAARCDGDRLGNLIYFQLSKQQLMYGPMQIESRIYVESIYIQATEARMPQLKKVVLAMGNRLIYRDTFGEALAELTGGPASGAPALAAVTSAPAPASAAAGQGLPALAERLHSLRDQAEHLARELETLEKEARKKEI